MLDSIINELIKERYIFLLMIGLSVIFSVFLLILSRVFKFKRNKLSIFSVIFGLNRKQLVCLGLIIGRLLFIICILVLGTNINVYYLIAFSIYSLILLFINNSFKTFLVDFGLSLAIFFGLFMEKILYSYYLNAYEQLMYGILILASSITIVLASILQVFLVYENIIYIVQNNKKST